MLGIGLTFFFLGVFVGGAWLGYYVLIKISDTEFEEIVTKCDKIRQDRKRGRK